MNAPDTPTMLWDGECRFCRRWIERWKRVTKGKVAFHPYQDVIKLFPQVNEEACQHAVQLIMPNGKVYSAAHAVFKSLAEGGRYKWLLECYERRPTFRSASEHAYQFVTRNRSWLPKI